MADRYRAYLPDFVAVLSNRAIGRELAHSRRVEDRHSCPGILIPVGLADAVLTVHVRLIIGEQQVLVMLEQGIDERFEHFTNP